MNIPYLIQLLTNRLQALTTAKDQAFMSGDLERINSLDDEMNSVQNTLSQLNMVLQMQQVAQAANTTTAEVVASMVAQTQAPSIQGPSASAVVNGYNISAYATDPQFEQKIQTLVNAIPAFASAAEMDAYIQAVAPGSPITADMVLNAVMRYGVDQPLLIAIMQNDSTFGTLGVGARTFNPGNVGNTGTAEQSYPSWQDGVNAVADWLNNHRVVPVPAVDPTVVAPAAAPVTAPVATSAPQNTNTPAPTEPVILSTPNTQNATSSADTASTTPPIIDTDATTTPTTTSPSDSATSTPNIDTGTTTATSTATTTTP